MAEGWRNLRNSIRQKTRASEIDRNVGPIAVPQDYAPAHSFSHGVTDKIERTNPTGRNQFVTSENLRQVIQQSDFMEALTTLQDISFSQIQQFMISEHYCQIGESDKALRCIEALQTTMTSYPRPNVDDVIKLVETFITDSFHIRALILLSCCPKLYKLESNPDKSVVGIRYSSLQCGIIITSLVKKGGGMKKIATIVGLKIITDMLREFQSVSTADKNEKAVNEAGCLNNVGLSHRVIGEYEQAIGFYSEGIYLLKQRFGSNAPKYRVLSDLLNNMGLVYHNLGDYFKAESLYIKSLNMRETSEDWFSDKVKHECIKGTKVNLASTRDRILYLDLIGKCNNVIELIGKDISLLKQTNLSNSRMFGDLLFNLASSHHSLDDYSNAESFYLKSLDVYEKAKDWPNENEKRESIERVKNNLKFIRSKLKN
ncbi:uncharacterized protein LOC120343125 [Styela clava]